LTSENEASLRRLERDLHDGTQARLVAVGIALARLENRITEPAHAEMVTSAKHAVTETLDELREIIRHPPALDSGLEIALTTLAGRCELPVQLTYLHVALSARRIDSKIDLLRSERTPGQRNPALARNIDRGRPEQH
jgi:signal transduction histidine kinase